MRSTRAINRDVAAAAAAVFVLGLGEELWRKFLPKYLETLGASAVAIGAFAAAENFLDAAYQYPGGWLADRAGRRRSLHIFLALTAAGYAVYLLSTTWQTMFAGLALAMAWRSMASPAIFAVIGDALPSGRRAAGFTLQSLLKRVPMIVSPIAGGLTIAALGIAAGMRWGLAATLALAGGAALLVRAIEAPARTPDTHGLGQVWRSFSPALRRLLVADIVIRAAEALSEVFLVLWVTDVAGLSARHYGTLVALQAATSLLAYIPAAAYAPRVGEKPFVLATFVCFGLFPAAVASTTRYTGLLAAYVIGGLREIGEPARKALIVDLADPRMRARTVGLYYLLRGLAITPFAAAGGVLWGISPRAPLLAAGAVGLAGTLVAARVDAGKRAPS